MPIVPPTKISDEQAQTVIRLHYQRNRKAEEKTGSFTVSGSIVLDSFRPDLRRQESSFYSLDGRFTAGILTARPPAEAGACPAPDPGVRTGRLIWSHLLAFPQPSSNLRNDALGVKTIRSMTVVRQIYYFITYFDPLHWR